MGWTVTGNWQASWLPEASVAVHSTIVVPCGKKLPEGGVQTSDAPGQLSEKVVV